MSAHRARRHVRNILDDVPWPSTILGLLAVVIVGLVLAASTLPTNDTPAHVAPGQPTATNTIDLTPDDPAAAHSTPVQVLEH